MGRKTRKQKENAAKRRIAGSASDILGTSTVKGEFEFRFNIDKLGSKKITAQKNPDNSVRFAASGSYRSDIIKTIVLASGIFVLEFVIYSRWFK